MVTAPELYFHIKKALEKNGIESPQFEAMCIAEHIFQKKLTALLLDKSIASESQITASNNILFRRINGEPLQYLLGEWEFYGMTFFVGNGVLIPRADTETLVDFALEKLKNMQNAKVVDLCSGSGCIACAVAKNSNCEVTAVELSDNAYHFLEKNIKKHNLDIVIKKGDVLKDETTQNFSDIDMILCNPPYLTQNDMENLQKEVTFEPESALFGGQDGLDFYRGVTNIWKKALKTGGILAYEIGMGQEEDVKKIMSENSFENINEIKDLSGIIRVILGEKA